MECSISQLKEQIKNNNLQNLYLFFGEETYLRDSYASKIKKIAESDDFACFNYLYFNSETEDFKAFVSFLESFPTMSDRKIAVLKDCSFLRLAEHTASMKKVLENIPDYATVLFIESEYSKIKKDLLGIIRKKGAVAEFKYQTRHDLSAWVVRKLSQSGKEMHPDDIMLLIDLCDCSLTNIDRECDKLIASVGKGKVITRSQIDLIVKITSEYKIFNMADNLLKNEKNEAYKLLKELKLNKEEPRVIIPMIYNQFASIYMFWQAEREKNVNPADFLPANKKFLAKRYKESAGKNSGKRLREAMKLCADYDLKAKTGLIDGFTALEIIMATVLSIN